MKSQNNEIQNASNNLPVDWVRGVTAHTQAGAKKLEVVHQRRTDGSFVPVARGEIGASVAQRVFVDLNGVGCELVPLAVALPIIVDPLEPRIDAATRNERFLENKQNTGHENLCQSIVPAMP